MQWVVMQFSLQREMVRMISIRHYAPDPIPLKSKPWSVKGVGEISDGGFSRKIALKSADWVFAFQSVRSQMNRAPRIRSYHQPTIS
ncbi:hypothetical protein NPIL_491741 [Nephila pilipes]|uniref:Uncharacterized protein n=1 Tax=Nephila pilipes TaxID=299642 RepID=A0A8X6N9X0_NEPPI|nr:hypothetical protein NPIL_491741 [Nephila pilipes]